MTESVDPMVAEHLDEEVVPPPPVVEHALDEETLQDEQHGSKRERRGVAQQEVDTTGLEPAESVVELEQQAAQALTRPERDQLGELRLSGRIGSYLTEHARERFAETTSWVWTREGGEVYVPGSESIPGGGSRLFLRRRSDGAVFDVDVEYVVRPRAT